MSKQEELQKISVTNSISMSLNQNDLIELAIQEKMSQIEPVMYDLEQDIIRVTSEMNKTMLEQAKLEVSKKLKSLASYKDIEATAKAVNKLVEYSYSIEHHYHASDKKNLIGEYKEISLSTVQEYKDPYSYAKFHYSTSTAFKLFIQTVTVTGVITFPSGVKVTMSEKIYDINSLKYIELQVTYQKMLCRLRTKLFDTKMEYLEFKYGEKRIKAKLVRASLSKSSDGQAILDMLSKATNVKLLG